MKKSRYIVRSGTHNGQYITNRIRVVKGAASRKYAWSKNRWDALKLTYEQARGVVRRLGGEMVVVA